MKTKRLNRMKAIEFVEKAIKLFEGRFVEFTIRPALDRPSTLDHVFVVPVLQARKTEREVEFLIPAGWREPNGGISTRVRTFSISEGGYDPEDQIFRVVGNGGLFADLEAYGMNSKAFFIADAYKKDPDLLASVVLEGSRTSRSDGSSPIGGGPNG